MSICPDNLEMLSAALRAAHANRERISLVDLQAFQRVVEYHPEDMTVTAEAGLTLAVLQKHLSAHGQWLPLDPPNADRATLADVLSTNASGPRRFGYGTIREHLIGLKVVLADGRVIKSGGKVVKNVAGYDLQKLFVGSQGTLGVIVEATFKVRPVAEKEEIVAITCSTLENASERIEAVLASDLSPIVLDLHNLPERGWSQSAAAQDTDVLRVEDNSRSNSTSEARQVTKRPEGCIPITLVLGFDGTREEVDWQKTKVSTLGEAVPTNLDYDKHFGNNGTNGVHRRSILPSRLTEVISMLGCEQFVARAGNGVVYYRGGTPPPKSEVPTALTQRVKDIFDPNHVFPELSL
jgi:FAD/FMN-containing dehydrogenase